ncbi:MAG TPA: cyclic nucleotide-binding domain-containing protein [Povalibacter sp.]|uniref:cyclic nucleotide-binding domain-containing protein n=1 Tax=Povalibacter sp. TaxID=1962978 RepID=UPI002C2FB9D4|nr:cyclic nucleotide-binding domain-containing protein [Povalibacter sp.]HMN46372.1 cyclic nucleotide-binding domain-containing protein [Povalibacter sp.]
MSSRATRDRGDARARPFACSDCDLNELCRLAVLLAHRDGRERPARGTFRVLDAGARLFRSGGAAGSVFAVRQGTIKTVHLTEDGHERVIAFHVPGEIIGLEAFGSRTYRCDAIALEQSVCCELPVPRNVEHLAAVVNLLGTAVVPRLPLTRGPMRERVTGFLADHAERLRRHGFDGRRFRLAMSRGDIANLLDTSVETVSRILQQLHREKAIHVRGSTIELLTLASGERD